MVKNHFFKSTVLFFILFAAMVAKAQHDPYYTHFRFNQQAYNPAAAGTKEGFICVSGLSHFQYRQYTDYTPTSGTDVLNGSENSKNVAPETYNLNLNSLIPLDKRGRHKLGVGLTLVSDQIGFMKTTTVKGAVNYRKPIQGNFGYFSFGLEIGSTSFGYKTPNFRYIDPNDPHIPAQGGSGTELDLGVGVYYHQKKLFNKLDNFYIGASYNHLNAANYNFTLQMADGTNGAVDVDFVRYLYVTSGADWQLANPNWKLEPAVLVKYNPKLQLDLSMTALFDNRLRGGLAYRTAADAISVLIGYEKGQLQVGYSYDITLSKIRKVSDGTHEIFLKYCFPIHFHVDTPPKKFRLTPRFMGRGAY